MPRTLPTAIVSLLAIAAPVMAQDPAPVTAPQLIAQGAAPAVDFNDAPAADSWHFWARPEYLIWFIRGDHSPVPLATTGPAGAARAGALDLPTTNVLIGPDLNYKPNSGGKLTLGDWLDNAGTIGVEASGFCLETHTIHEKAYSNRTDGAPVIARPYFNTLTGQQDAQFITGPADALGGRYLGGVDLFSDSRTWGGELNMLFNVANTPQSRWDLVGGFRYLGQKDQLQIDQSSTVLIPGTVGFAGLRAPGPDIVSVGDYLQTTNSFYGAQIGMQGHWQSGQWQLEAAAKVGLGTNQEQLEAQGYTLLTDSAGVSLYRNGGLFVPSNLSQLDAAKLGFMSEVNVRIGYRITERWVASVGYTFLYWTNVLLPGGQINPVIDPRTLPSSLSYNPAIAPPAFQLHATDYWAQGLTFGLEYRY